MTVTYSLAVDIGGTFTDIVLRHSSGVLTVDKVLTTHQDLLEGFFAGVANVMRAAKITPRDVDGVVVHATTLVTNVQSTPPINIVTVPASAVGLYRLRF